MLHPSLLNPAEEIIAASKNTTWEKDLDTVKLPGYSGAFPSDNLPPNSRLQSNRAFSFIANTKPASSIGEHWVAFYFPPDKRYKAIFIEPYGTNLHLTNPSFHYYLRMNSLNTETLPFGIQPLLTPSYSCGQFCIYVIAHLPFYMYNIKTLCQAEFSAVDRQFNERKVLKWWTSNYKRLHSEVKL